MVGKLCAAPRGGGSSGGLVEYLVGYAISAKGATRDEISAALDGVYAEAESRDDLGAGGMWSPEAGGGTRPSSILVSNCASFSTASLEMDADVMLNPGVKTGAMHFVWSWNESESGLLSDDHVHQYVGEVLAKLDLAHHRSVAVVHRDTNNLHVHVAVGSVDPGTGLAYDRTGLFRRMAWAEREVELAHQLDHDHGLAVVQDAGLPSAHVRWADKHELIAWRAERREERLVRQERRSFEGYRERDVTFERYADATVAPRLRGAMSVAERDGRAPDWATMHSVAARYGCAIQRDHAGVVVIRDVGIREMQLQHEQARRTERDLLKAQGLDRDEVDQQVAAMRSMHEKAEVAERGHKIRAGDVVPVGAFDLDVAALGEFRDSNEAERQIAERVEADPGLVLRDVTTQSSTFTREDVDLWLASRISDPSEIERLGDLVVAGGDVRVLSADTMQPIMTTTEVLDIEDRLADDAAALARTPSGITPSEIEHAIEAHEAHLSAIRLTRFSLSGEQRAALGCIARGSVASIEGLPGTGKTTIMGVVRIIGEQTGREVVGLTLSQAAAERLESEAGFACVNTARAQILEERGEQVVPHNGIVVVDEAAMVDCRSNARILHLARERGSIVVEVGDTRQLQPIAGGSSFRIVRDAARAVGTHMELRDVQRQSRAWHREAVVTLADAITERDESKRVAMVREALGLLDQHGAIAWASDRDAAIDSASGLARKGRAEGSDTITVASDRDTVRHLAEEGRRRDGLEGTGRRYRTDGGVREFAPGDRLMFRENSLGKRGLGVRNGDRGEVVAVERNRIDVRMRDGRTVRIDPRRYRAIDHGSATTVHAVQGASVDATVAVIDRSASAELVFVAVSRSRDRLDIVVPRTAFRNLDELAAHVADRISLKTTTRTYDELLERTGGKDTIRVRNIEAQREAAPLRRVYDAEIAEPARAQREGAVATERASYRARLQAIAGDPTLSLTDRFVQQDAALRDFRATTLGVYRAAAPTPFGSWLASRDAAHSRAREIRQRRELERDQNRIRQTAERPTHRNKEFDVNQDINKRARGAMPIAPRAREQSPAIAPRVRERGPSPTPELDALQGPRGEAPRAKMEQAQFTAGQRGQSAPAHAAPQAAKTQAPSQSRGEAAKASAQATATKATTRAAEPPAKTQAKGIQR